MAKNEAIIWKRWSVVLPAVGAVFTGVALWYGNLSGGEPADAGGVNQVADDGGVNINGDNSGIVVTDGTSEGNK